MWQDCGAYRVHSADQRSPGWHEEREKLGATTTKLCDIRRYMEGKGDNPANKPPPEENDAMRLGNKLEPAIRQWFVKRSGYLPEGAVVKELGLAVPKFYPKIGASTDGLIIVDDKPVGIIEIKTTAKMYESLTSHSPSAKQIEYISQWHYDQMQGCMAIMGMNECFYIVYEHTTNTMHVERVFFNEEHWNRRLYPAVYYYIENGCKR